MVKSDNLFSMKNNFDGSDIDIEKDYENSDDDKDDNDYDTIIIITILTIRSSDNDSSGFWPPGSLHTLGADGHI